MSEGLHGTGRILIKILRIGKRKTLLRRLAALIRIVIQNRNGLVIVWAILLPISVWRCLNEGCQERHCHDDREKDAPLFHCTHCTHPS